MASAAPLLISVVGVWLGVASGASLATPRDALGYRSRSLVAADRLARCEYGTTSGAWSNEALWQSGNTLEAFANLAIAQGNASLYAEVFQNSYLRTAPVLDQCFDDHQWWLLGWVRAYEATGEVLYLERAAQVFDFVVANGWTSQCGGGILWCPESPGTDGYKNAITNELFLTAAMKLHPYETVLGRAPGFYLGWAQREWDWFAGSGLVNGAWLVNDGLNGSCSNNNQTTWTYNQGVLLDGAARLSAATGNSSALDVASRVAAAAMTLLVAAPDSPIMSEPCGAGGCDGDQQIFKGVFVRHLSGLLQSGTAGPALVAQARAFLAANAASLLANASCAAGGGYGLLWEGPCGANVSVATSSAGLDLLTAASLAELPAGAAAPALVALGLGNCVDASGAAMPNCYNANTTEAACAAALGADPRAVAYDFSQPCGPGPWGFCRVRTLSGAGSCAGGWGFTGGSATSVTGADGSPLTVCIAASQGGA